MYLLQLVTVFVKMKVLSTAHPVRVTVFISSVEISVKVSSDVMIQVTFCFTVYTLFRTNSHTLCTIIHYLWGAVCVNK